MTSKNLINKLQEGFAGVMIGGAVLIVGVAVSSLSFDKFFRDEGRPYNGDYRKIGVAIRATEEIYGDKDNNTHRVLIINEKNGGRSFLYGVTNETGHIDYFDAREMNRMQTNVNYKTLEREELRKAY